MMISCEIHILAIINLYFFFEKKRSLQTELFEGWNYLKFNHFLKLFFIASAESC